MSEPGHVIPRTLCARVRVASLSRVCEVTVGTSLALRLSRSPKPCLLGPRCGGADDALDGTAAPHSTRNGPPEAGFRGGRSVPRRSGVPGGRESSNRRFFRGAVNSGAKRPPTMRASGVVRDCVLCNPPAMCAVRVFIGLHSDGLLRFRTGLAASTWLRCAPTRTMMRDATQICGGPYGRADDRATCCSLRS